MGWCFQMVGGWGQKEKPIGTTLLCFCMFLFMFVLFSRVFGGKNSLTQEQHAILRCFSLQLVVLIRSPPVSPKPLTPPLASDGGHGGTGGARPGGPVLRESRRCTGPGEVLVVLVFFSVLGIPVFPVFFCEGLAILGYLGY